MKLKFLLLTIFGIFIFTIVACTSNNNKHYRIGVSQCSEDSWRTKLVAELEQSTYFNEDVDLIFTSAHDDSERQKQQIDSLVNIGIDLLIVSPNQVSNLSDIIGKVYDKGIPVILYDRKTDSGKYTAFMGADNYLIGEMLANYLANKLNEKGCIVEISGLEESSPAKERHDGFVNGLKKYPNMQIVATESGDWTEISGENAMQKILRTYDGRIDAVFGGNDRMAIGARHALNSAKKDSKNIIFLGVDALPTKGHGIEQVADSLLTASAIYPTHGDELLELALNILNGKDFNRETMLRSSIVTSDNAKVLQLQHEEIERQAQYLKKMHTQAGIMHDSIKMQQWIILLILLFVVLASVALVVIIRAYRQKHTLYKKVSTLNKDLQTTNEQLMTEKEIAERQRDELEEQRDKLIEVTTNQSLEEDDVLTGEEPTFRKENEFMQRFYAILDENISNSDLSVEDIGEKMCFSRVQLYRKVKALTGQSPVELIRTARLERGKQLLADTSLNVSEIAYRVGFSSPNYFSKCYKDHFGKSPRV